MNNLFQSAGDVGADEWKSSRSADEENAEKEMLQFVWALPYVPPAVDSTPLEVHSLVRRVSSLPRGMVPKDCEYLTMAVDLGKWLCHWVVVAWSEAARGHVVDYGRVEVPSDQLGVERGLLAALRELRDVILGGWPEAGSDDARVPDQVWVDMGYMAGVVYDFCRESSTPAGWRFRPSQGLGASQDQARKYNQPRTKGTNVRHVGEGYHLSRLEKERLHLVEVNADHWKTWVHRRLSGPIDVPGAMTLFHATPNEHLSFAKHLTAEKQVEEFIAGKGTVVRWEKVRQNNHWLDALYNASAAGHFCGARLIRAERKKPPARQPRPRTSFTTPDGRPWLVTERGRY